MASVMKVIEGLQILSRYPESSNVNAERDIIYAGPPSSEVVSDDDRKRLHDLGWHVSSEFGCWARFT